MSQPAPTELKAALATLLRAVRTAGELQLEGAHELRVEEKGAPEAPDIVTDVDRRCEARVLELIAAAHPDHAVLAEEGGGQRVAEGPLWVLDPLDGTKNYAHGLPRFGCSLALLWSGVAQLGAVYNPALDELFVAERGAGATCNGGTIAVSSTQSLRSAMVATALTVRRAFSEPQFTRLRRLVGAVQGVRVGGCAALDLCDVARGRLDAYFEEGLDPWDTAAGSLIVCEAGGAVTGFAGAAHDPFGNETMASTPAIARALQTLLREG